MKVIEFKLNNKLVFCEQVKEITIADFLKRQKAVLITWREKDEKIISLENELSKLNEYCDELKAKVDYLAKQIAIDRGEIDEDSEEEYELVLVSHEEEQPQQESEEQE